MPNICTWTGATDGDPNKTANWLEGDVPDDGDIVNIVRNPTGADDVSIDANLDSLSAVTVAELNIDAGYTGEIGTAAAYWEIGATVCRIGEAFGPGSKIHSPRVKLDFGSVQTSVTVFGSRTIGTETDLPPVRLIGTHASNVLTIRGGNVGVACESGEVATIATLTAGADMAAIDPNVLIGSGVTLTTLTVSRGAVLLMAAATTITQTGGTVTTERAGAVTTVTVSGNAVFVGNSTGTITTLNANGGTVDLLRSASARTVTTLNMLAGASLRYDPSVVTVTSKIVPSGRVVLTASEA